MICHLYVDKNQAISPGQKLDQDQQEMVGRRRLDACCVLQTKWSGGISSTIDKEGQRNTKSFSGRVAKCKCVGRRIGWFKD